MEEMLEGIEGMESIGDQVNAAGQMGIATAVFPDREVGIGDTWTTSVVNQSSVPMLMKATYTLIDIQKDVVEIELYGESALYESDEVDPSLAAAFSELTGDFSGTLTVDRQTGITLQAAVTQQMQMKVLQGGIPLTVDVINEIRLDGKP
jgi:hypothetical protein